jgi:hypothetical protein
MATMTRKWLMTIGTLFVFSFSCQGEALYTINPADFIYGKWQYERLALWKLGSYTKEQVEQIKASTLHIEKDRIYFKGIDFVELRTFTKEEIKLTKLKEFNEDDVRISYSSSGPLRFEYTLREFKELYRIELGPPYALALLYLDQDQETLIVNYCGGVCFFMKKLPHVQQVYKGAGKAEYELIVPEHSTYLSIRYKFDRLITLIVQDQDGSVLCHTKTGTNQATKTIKLPLSQISKLTFKVTSPFLECQWWFNAAIY